MDPSWYSEFDHTAGVGIAVTYHALAAEVRPDGRHTQIIFDM